MSDTNKNSAAKSTHLSSSECEWLGYELHDGLLQFIMSSRMSVEDVSRQLALLETIPEGVTRQLELTQRFLELAIEDGRQLIQFIEGHVLPEASKLATQLTQYIDVMAGDTQGQRIVLHSPESWPNLEPRMGWNVLRILQQAIRNAVQHAGPCVIDIRCAKLELGGVRYEVVDDGAGFHPQASPAKATSFGITGMKHRARLINAQLDIQSTPGAGTRVQLDLHQDAILPQAD